MSQLFSGHNRTQRRRRLLLLWLALGAVILLSIPRILAQPMSPATAGPHSVVISEMVADNGGSILDEDGDPSDWIELWNRGATPVNLRDWALTDEADRPAKWNFGDVTLEPDGRLLVFASGKDRTRIRVDEETGQAGFLHTNFRLKADSGFLALYPPTSRRYLDATEVTYPVQHPDVSYGLHADLPAGRFGYLTPTPAEANDGSLQGVGLTASIRFSHDHGLYDAPIRLTLSSDTPGAIHYTLDATPPTADSPRYRSPLPVDGTTIVRAALFQEGMAVSPVATRSYLFPDEIVNQPAHPPGWPAAWGTHRIDFAGAQAGTPVEADYAMDPAVAADPVDGPTLPDALRSLPTLSLVTEPANLDIYAAPQDRGRQTERPVSVEFFGGDSAPDPGFQIDAGVRIQGGAGRWEFMPKHSFRLFFRQEYGAGRLDYPIFDDTPVQSFDTLVLRAGVDRSFAGHPATAELPVDHRQTTYARDEWVRAGQIDMSGVGVRGRFVHLYLNGLYWGIYNVVERPDAVFMADYFGGDRSEYGSVNHGGPVSGPMDRFDVLMTLADQGGLADPARYRTMLEFIDPAHFADYLILNWYAGNVDWPENNWYANVHYPAGRNYFFVWDAESTWDDGARIVLGGNGFAGAPFPNVVKRVFLALLENPEFRLLFADRLYAHVRPGGALSDDASVARWQRVTAPLEPAIVAESARWGDVRYADPVTPADWRAAVEAVQAQMAGNGDRLLRLARDAGYYPRVDPPRFMPDEPIFRGSRTVQMRTETGEIYFTTDGTDPRLAESGAIAPTAQRYSEPLTMETLTTVKARVLADGVWSALQEVTYRRAEQQPDVRFTEIMYNPLGGERYEFLEIANLGEAPADLSLARLTGVDYVFPYGAVLPPGGVRVIVADFKRFRERYPTPEIHGVYSGVLSDRGETVALMDRWGRVLDQVAYDDTNGWPLSADGVGDSLTLIATQEPRGRSSDHDDVPVARPQDWAASAAINGSPGEVRP